MDSLFPKRAGLSWLVISIWGQVFYTPFGLSGPLLWVPVWTLDPSNPTFLGVCPTCWDGTGDSLGVGQKLTLNRCESLFRACFCDITASPSVPLQCILLYFWPGATAQNAPTSSPRGWIQQVLVFDFMSGLPYPVHIMCLVSQNLFTGKLSPRNQIPHQLTQNPFLGIAHEKWP